MFELNEFLLKFSNLIKNRITKLDIIQKNSYLENFDTDLNNLKKSIIKFSKLTKNELINLLKELLKLNSSYSSRSLTQGEPHTATDARGLHSDETNLVNNLILISLKNIINNTINNQNNALTNRRNKGVKGPNRKPEEILNYRNKTKQFVIRKENETEDQYNERVNIKELKMRRNILKNKSYRRSTAEVNLARDNLKKTHKRIFNESDKNYNKRIKETELKLYKLNNSGARFATNSNSNPLISLSSRSEPSAPDSEREISQSISVPTASGQESAQPLRRSARIQRLGRQSQQNLEGSEHTAIDISSDESDLSSIESEESDEISSASDREPVRKKRKTK